MPWAGQGRIFCMGYPAKGGGGKEINRPLRIFPFFPLLGEKQQKKHVRVQLFLVDLLSIYVDCPPNTDEIRNIFFRINSVAGYS